MIFNERNHAFLVCSYYKALKEKFGEKGIQTFIKATKKYAEQRGHRMALRVKEHGFDNDYPSYLTHSEWVKTPEEFDVKFIENVEGDVVTDTRKCPWHTQFKEMNMIECGVIYCQYIDKHLVKGFNPNLGFNVSKQLYSSEICELCFQKANVNKDRVKVMKESSKKYGKSNTMPFDYHTGHLYKTFKEVILEDFSLEGQLVVDQAINDFKIKYGKEALDEILKFEDTDFDKLPQ